MPRKDKPLRSAVLLQRQEGVQQQLHRLHRLNRLNQEDHLLRLVEVLHVDDRM